MVHISLIEARLSQLGVKLSRWFQGEVKELQHILFNDEKIIAAVPGRYFAGFALLVATDYRVLLIDKRALFINIEDIRYDMISETDFNSRFVDATLQIFTLNKQHRFTSSKYKRQLRDLTNYVQQRIMELRGYQNVINPPASTSLMPANQADRYPSPSAQVSLQPARFAAPTITQSKVVGAAAITAIHRRPHLVSGAFSTRTNIPATNSVR
jgi:hypothetical protein